MSVKLHVGIIHTLRSLFYSKSALWITG